MLNVQQQSKLMLPHLVEMNKDSTHLIYTDTHGRPKDKTPQKTRNTLL